LKNILWLPDFKFILHTHTTSIILLAPLSCREGGQMKLIKVKSKAREGLCCPCYGRIVLYPAICCQYTPTVYLPRLRRSAPVVVASFRCLPSSSVVVNSVHPSQLIGCRRYRTVLLSPRLCSGVPLRCKAYVPVFVGYHLLQQGRFKVVL